jgi:hypothetical protein
MQLCNQTVTTAVSTTVGDILELRAAPGGPLLPASVAAQFTFTYAGSTGTSAVGFLQSSIDGGQTYFDVAAASFGTSSGKTLFNIASSSNATVTPSSGSLTANTAIGTFGPLFRALLVSQGTYQSGTSLKIDLFGSNLTQFISGQ